MRRHTHALCVTFDGHAVQRGAAGFGRSHEEEARLDRTLTILLDEVVMADVREEILEARFPFDAIRTLT